jgi:hypothetical protein
VGRRSGSDEEGPFFKEGGWKGRKVIGDASYFVGGKNC